MYSIRACTDPAHLEVVVDGVLDAAELVRCISQVSALAEAGDAKKIRADFTDSDGCELDRGLVVATLQARVRPEIMLAIVAPNAMARGAQLLLRRVGWSEYQARTFATPDEAGSWLRLNAPSSLTETDLRHVDHAAALLAPSDGASPKKADRKSVA